MNCYPIIRPLVHALPPEVAHEWSLKVLSCGLLPPARFSADPCLAQRVFGLSFAHPLGLAAGFDKNACAVDALHAQGFAFVEAGTVTPLAQPGNPRPRIFRLPQDRAVINRLGFNNDGLDVFVANLSARRGNGIVGANIGKNKDAPDAVADYLIGLERVYPQADYITINISSPNTQGLRTLQKREQLTQLLSALIGKRNQLSQASGRRVPLLLKIAPDLDEAELADVAEVALTQAVDGLIVSNTTIKRPRTLTPGRHGEQGGLSGAPLFSISTEVLAQIYRLTGGKIPLIGVGGVSSAADAYKKIRSGASLVQLYTALIYQGFSLVRQVVEGLPELLARDGFSSVEQAVGADLR